MRITGIINLFCAACFLGIISYLQSVQPEYNSTYQLMSELALEQQGFMMLFAFLAFSGCIASNVYSLFRLKAPWIVLLPLSTASAAMLGAGFITLIDSAELHSGLVALAFIMLGLVMCILPMQLSFFRTTKLTTWLILAATITLLGGNILEMGITQRATATFVLLWSCWIELYIWRQERRNIQRQL